MTGVKHSWGTDGFCLYGCRMHRTDWRKNDVCYVRQMANRRDCIACWNMLCWNCKKCPTCNNCECDWSSGQPVTEEDKALLRAIAQNDSHGLIRKLMDKDEQQRAIKLTKLGLVYAGRSDDKQRSICYFLTRFGETAVN